MIRVENLKKAFGTNLVLDSVSFDIEPGQIVGLVGPSGGGKSVLIKIIAGVLEPDAGEVVSKDGELFLTGFLFQEGALFDSMSVLENVAFPLSLERAKKSENTDFSTNLTDKAALDIAYDMLGEVGLSHAYAKYPGQLSGGMRRRVALARALVAKPELLLLDDPTGGLDPVAASVIIELIKKFHSSYSPTVLIVSHDLRRLLPNVERVLGLFDGKIQCDEVPANLANKVSPEILHFLETRFNFSSMSL